MGHNKAILREITGQARNRVFIAEAILRTMPVLKPPLEKQRHIAHILQTADAKIAAEQDRKGALQALMTGRLRVCRSRWRHSRFTS